MIEKKRQKDVKKLNIGCGLDIKKDCINLDASRFKDVDLVHNLDNYPWPFKDNTFEEVYCFHVLEHLVDVVKAMQEIWRISKKGAIINIEVPYYTSLNAVKDPTHKHFFASATFDFFDKEKLGDKNYFALASGMDFKILERKIIYSNNKLLRILNPLFNISHNIYERFFSHIFPANVLKVKLRVIKK